MTTFGLSFHDTDKPRQDQFLGVAIFDMDESEGEKSAEEIVRHAHQLGINPGGEVIVAEVVNKQIKPEHKNRLITDTVLLRQWGFEDKNGSEMGLVCDLCGGHHNEFNGRAPDGLRLSFETPLMTRTRNPNQPVLYCIDYDKGFVKGNVLVISQRALDIVKMLAAPSSERDKRVKKIWGKTFSEMSPGEERVAKANIDCVAACQKHGEKSPEHLAAIAAYRAAEDDAAEDAAQ